MGKYNFDVIINRKNTNSVKWNNENELPMWVADMDFQTVPEVIEELHKIVDHGIFGYCTIPETFRESVVNWNKRNNLLVEKEWVLYAPGIMPAISSIIRKFTSPADNVLIMTPVYNSFFNSILHNGRNVQESLLVYRNNQYEIDFSDLEEKLKHPNTSLMLLCSPHNPVGKVWSKTDLRKIADLTLKHNVLVVADEIHSDLCHSKNFIPFATVSENAKNNSITCKSVSKTFNLASIHCANVIIPSEYIRNKVLAAFNTDKLLEPNTFAITAATTAYNKGEQWLQELNEYLISNINICKDFLEKEIPNVKLVNPSALYLLWLDCSKITSDTSKLCEHLLKETGLNVTAGSTYGESGKNFIRMNIACPKATLDDGLNRLKKGIDTFKD
ncbi:MAG: MalY/PatB family protein [Lachnospirales bacterium]